MIGIVVLNYGISCGNSHLISLGNVSSEGFQRLHKLLIIKLVYKLICCAIIQTRHASMSIDNCGKPIIHTIENSSRSFTTR